MIKPNTLNKEIMIILGLQTKLISEEIVSFEKLEEKIRDLFHLDKNLKLRLFVIDDDTKMKTKLDSNFEFSEVIKTNNEICLKIKIEVEGKISNNEDENFYFVESVNSKNNVCSLQSSQLKETSDVSHQQDDHNMDLSPRVSVKKFISTEGISSKEYIKNNKLENIIIINKNNTEQYGTSSNNQKDSINHLNNEIDFTPNFLNNNSDDKEQELLGKIDDLMNSKISVLEEKINSILYKNTKYTNDNTSVYTDFFNNNRNCLETQDDIQIKIKHNSQRVDTNKLDFKLMRDQQNNIRLQGSEIEFVDIDREYEDPPDRIFLEICSICSRKIYYIKYSCCICSNMTICQQCENFHSHPMIKFKANDISTKEDILYLMITQQEKKNSDVGKGFLKKVRELSETIFSKKYKLKLSVYSDRFCVRPNKKFKIPLILCNETKVPIGKGKLLIMTKNTKDLKIPPLILDSDLGYKQKYEFNIEGESNNQLKTYDFEIFLYSTEARIECDARNMKIEVNLDREDELLNEYFAMYSILFSIPKYQKEMIKSIIFEGVSGKDPYLIYSILTKYKWDLDKALEELTLEIKPHPPMFNNKTKI